MAQSAFRDFLKTGTQPHHRRVDDAFSRFDLSHEHGIEGFLTAQAAALIPLEAALEAESSGSVVALIADWPARRRSHLLDRLSLDVPRLAIGPLADKNAVLGALYVLEGSKLGARFLAKRVAATHGSFGPAALRFLLHDTGSGRWASMLEQLDHAASPPFDGALHGAAAAFSLFEAAATIVADRQETGGPIRNPPDMMGAIASPEAGASRTSQLAATGVQA